MAEKFKPEYIYADAEEKYVKAVVLYTDSEFLYYDEAHEHVVNGADLLNFFLKGLIIADESGYYMNPSLFFISEIDNHIGDAAIRCFISEIANTTLFAPFSTEE